MKRTSDYLNQNNSDINKKPKFSQASYGDMYSQYAGMNPATAMMMGSQYSASPSMSNAFPQGATSGPFPMGQFPATNGSMYGYSGTQAMIGTQFGGNMSSGFSSTFSPTAAAAMVGRQGVEISRTIYLGNVPKDANVTEILNYVKTGAIESIKVLPEKNCAFLTFVDPTSAQAFYQEHLIKKLTVQGTELKIGWGKPSPLSSNVQMAIQNGATRNVYLGQLDAAVTEESLREEMSKFGAIDQVKLLREKNIGFVHFTSISAAIKAVSTLPTESAWASRRVNYGKDRCAYIPKNGQQQQQQQQSGQYAFGFQHPLQSSFNFDPYNPAGSTASMMSQTYGGMAGNNLPRTLYLGSIPPDATCEDLCNSIRGGILFQIRYLAEKHIAFVTFVDPTAAMSVHNQGSFNGLFVKSRRIRVGWGKPMAIPAAVLMAVQQGATRNIYIGGIDENITEEKLRHDFEEYGEIELVNTLREKSCAFVNFTNIGSAMKALQGIKQNEEYSGFKINYGKDRCGNPPRRLHPDRTTEEGEHP
ncbi:hypothetical protein DFQ28_006342 [Apophysomyces sp. BC1034]|nr:hypothetical protein DFQ30_009131 [Apophysomyces sp. BC1015]KAG0181264.1 hypothetical protein DFQ29_008873 [Apophysomyces sp. BC1021]KAG0193119.1 hypothetical protein DFQ28_006342 [Apophysomyces sp. BC1034]